MSVRPRLPGDSHKRWLRETANDLRDWIYALEAMLSIDAYTIRIADGREFTFRDRDEIQWEIALRKVDLWNVWDDWMELQDLQHRGAS